jgi:hypothetical protein
MFSQTRTRSPRVRLAKNDFDRFTIKEKSLTVPVGDVLVGDTGSDIEHDDTTLAVDVVTITETTELLLTSGIPDIELDSTVVLCRSG